MDRKPKSCCPELLAPAGEIESAYAAFHYGADVWWDEPDADHGFTPRFPFLDLPNVAATPHNGDRIPGIDLEVTTVAARNVRRFLEGQSPANLVDPSDYIG